MKPSASGSFAGVTNSRGILVCWTIVAFASASCADVRSQTRAERNAFGKGSMTSETDGYPIVRVALGEPVQEAQHRSTSRFPRIEDTLVASVDMTDPTVVEFGQAPDVVRFPPAGFVSLGSYAGHVVQIRLSPHLQALTTDEVLRLADEIGRLLGSHGWRLARTYASPDSLRRASGLSAGADVYDQSLTVWARGGDQATLTAKRLHSPPPERPWDGAGPPPPRPDDRFLLDVRLDNDSVRAEYLKRLR